MSTTFLKLFVILAFFSIEFAKCQSFNVTFRLSAVNMAKCDINSDCDLFVSIMCSNEITDNWEYCGGTSVIHNNNDPAWPEIITLEHTPGIDEWWKFELIDEDFMNDHFIGAIEFAVEDYLKLNQTVAHFPVPDNTGTFRIHRRG